MSRYRTSRPDAWTQPRPHSDEAARRRKHGPLQPMAAQPSWLRRLLGIGRA